MSKQLYSVLIYTENGQIVIVPGFEENEVDGFVEQIADAMIEGDLVSLTREGESCLASKAYFLDEPDEYIAWIDPFALGVTAVSFMKEDEEPEPGDEGKKEQEKMPENSIDTGDDLRDEIAHVFACSIPIDTMTYTYEAAKDSKRETRKNMREKAGKKLVKALKEFEEACDE